MKTKLFKHSRIGLRSVIFGSLGCLLVLGMGGCSKSGNTSQSSVASMPTVDPAAPPVRQRPAGVPADRPRFPGETVR